MAPEQLRTPTRVDHRLDIYAIDVILFELLAGRPPFDAGSDTVLEEQIATAPARISPRSIPAHAAVARRGGGAGAGEGPGAPLRELRRHARRVAAGLLTAIRGDPGIAHPHRPRVCAIGPTRECR